MNRIGDRPLSSGGTIFWVETHIPGEASNYWFDEFAHGASSSFSLKTFIFLLQTALSDNTLINT